MKYSIILASSTGNIPSGKFQSLNIDERLFIKSLRNDSVNLYTIGLFYNKNDALKFLAYAKEKGFIDAYIVSQYEINSESESLLNQDAASRQTSGEIVYTIQLRATRNPVKMSDFKGIEGVREIVSEDGYYRYITGEFSSFSKAKAALTLFLESGFKDAFIRDLNLLNKK